MNLLKEFKAMPYHIRRKVLDRVYSVLMYTILFFVLFPILWMMYNSFKGNNDIVEGRVGLQRMPHNVLFVQKQGQDMFIGGFDGSVTNYDLKKNAIKDRRCFDGHNLNYIADQKYIWQTSADFGLIRINKQKLSDEKVVKIDWGVKKLDFNKISKTLVAVDSKSNKLWVTMGYKDYDKIIEYDTTTLKQTQRFTLLDVLPFSYDKIAISALAFINGELFVASNRGVAIFDPITGALKKVIEDEEFMVAEIRFFAYDAKNKKIYANSGNKLYVYDPKAAKLKQVYTTVTKDSMVQITSLTIVDEGIALGVGNGAIVVTPAGRLLRDLTSPMFDDINKKGKLIKKGQYVHADVISAQYVGQNMAYFGSSSGRISLIDLKQNKVLHTILIDKPGYFNVQWRNYIDVFNNVDFGLYLRNSFIICGFTALIAMMFATLTAYALVRFNFPGKQFLSTAILSTQMIPGVMLLIPIFIMFSTLAKTTHIQIQGTYPGLIFVYSAFFLPFSVWILRGFFASIPVALEEAATIDGCTPFQIFLRIALPLSVPGIVATGIFIFLVAWDELIYAWVLTNGATMTIPVGIRLFVGNFQNRYDLLMAASTVATIPVMIMFILLQKQIVSGLTAGAVKD